MIIQDDHGIQHYSLYSLPAVNCSESQFFQCTFKACFLTTLQYHNIN